MLCTGLEVALHDIDPVFFPAYEVRGNEVGGGQRLGIPGIGQFVSVVGHDHFLLAHQRPVIQFQGTGGTGVRCVVGQDRNLFDPALGRHVLPGTAGTLQRVGGVLEHDRLAGTPRRSGVGQFQLIVDVGVVDRLRHVLVNRKRDKCLTGDGQARHARRVDTPGIVFGANVDALIAQQEIPHRLGTRLRDRERHTGQYIIER
ncbi:hypothetical protein D3C84_481620 [compost metagenome]